MLFIVLQFVMPLIYLYNAFHLRKCTDYSKMEKGLATWRTRQSEEEWLFANQYASSLNAIYGVGLGIIVAGKYIIAGTRVLPYFNFVFGICAIVMGLTIVPITHRKLKEMFGEREYKYRQGLHDPNKPKKPRHHKKKRK